MKLAELLFKVQQREISVEAAEEQLAPHSYVDMDAASIDCGRMSRCHLPEAVLGGSKTVSQLLMIARQYISRSAPLLLTRLTEAQQAAVKAEFPDIAINALAGTGRWSRFHEEKTRRAGELVLCCAGTSDLPVLEEARETAIFMGREPVLLKDVGVAGIHRLLDRLDVLKKAKVIIVAAGMEGALPSVVSGMVSVPVIGLPTSVGYGVATGGIAALLGMLSSCSPGIAVMNIDNGFGAACLAERILSLDEHE